MTAPSSIDPTRFLHEQLGSASPDLLRQMLTTFMNTLDSTVKAYVADIVPSRRRGTAYGVFAAVQGVRALAGGVLAGALMTGHAGLLAWCVVGLQAVSLLLLLWILGGRGSRESPMSTRLLRR